MNTIYYQISAEVVKANKEIDNQFNLDDIVRIDTDDRMNGTMLKVSWSSIGGVSIKDAQNVANAIAYASKKAQEITDKYREFIID